MLQLYWKRERRQWTKSPDTSDLSHEQGKSCQRNNNTHHQWEHPLKSIDVNPPLTPLEAKLLQSKRSICHGLENLLLSIKSLKLKIPKQIKVEILTQEASSTTTNNPHSKIKSPP